MKATTHTHARHVLPDVIQKFFQRYPTISVKILQGLPDQIAQWVQTGEASLGLATLPSLDTADLTLLHCYEVQHVLITTPSHPLLKSGHVTLAAIAKYPLIGYDDAYQISSYIATKFKAANVTAHIVMRASDSDVIKTYVAAGLGVAIIPSLAYKRTMDRRLPAAEDRCTPYRPRAAPLD